MKFKNLSIKEYAGDITNDAILVQNITNIIIKEYLSNVYIIPLNL